MEMASRDYYVALKIPALYLNPVDAPQSDLLKMFISGAPSSIPILGGFAAFEEGVTELASQTGNWAAVMSWPGAPLSSGNLSALAGIDVEPEEYEPLVRAEKILATLGDAPVATVFTTDGDAIFYLMQAGFRETGGWDDIQLQGAGWTINPVMRDLAPIVWNHYVERRERTALVAGLSGAGYIAPTVMSDDQLRDYLLYADRYMSDAGLRVLHGSIDVWDARLGTLFAEGLGQADPLGIIYGYGGSTGPSPVDYHSSPIPSVAPTYVLNDSSVDAVIQDLLSRGGGSALINLGDPYIAHPDVMTIADSGVGGDAVLIPLSAASSCCLMVAIPTVLQPGSYDVTFAIKLPVIAGFDNVGRVYIGDQRTGWVELASRPISTADFAAPDQYTDITISFDVTEWISDAEIRVDYDNAATTEVIVDTVEVTNHDSVLPTFALVRLEWKLGSVDVPGRFADGIESGGGLMLTIEEFMAALNPEYLLDLAIRMVGADHPLVMQAEQELAQGEYAAALISVRRALRDA